MLRRDTIVADDLGREHIIPVRYWAKGDHPSPRIAFVHKEAAAIATGTAAGFKKQLAYSIIATGAITFVALALTAGGQSWFPSIFQYVWIVGMAIGALVGVGVRRAYFHKHKARMITMMTRNGLCAACGHETVGAPVDADGYLRCTECDAAWRADRFPAGSVAGPGAAEERDPVVKTIVSMFRGQRRTRAITDHRGRPAMLLARTPKEAGREDDAPDVAMRRREAEMDVRLARRPGRWAGVMLLVLFAATVVLGIGRSGGAAPATGTALTTVMNLGCVCLMLFGVAITFWSIWTDRLLTPPEHLDETLLAFGLCPGCSEDLHACVVEADGCRVCPVCAGAWRLLHAPGKDAAHEPDPRERSGVVLVARDDAGAPATVDRASWVRSPAWANPTMRAMLGGSVTKMGSAPRAFGRGVGLGVTAMLPASGMLVMLRVPPDTAFVVGATVGVVVFVVYVSLSAASAHVMSAPTFVLRAKRASVCAACGYSLVGLDVPADGLVVCPECGAKWRFASGAPSPGREDAATLPLGGERVQESALD